MKKLLTASIVFFALCAIMLSMSCNNGNTGNENNGNGNTTEPQYLTVTYHLGEHFTGEPPVDPKKYAVGEEVALLPIPETMISKSGEGMFIFGWAPSPEDFSMYFPNRTILTVKNTDEITPINATSFYVPPIELHLYPVTNFDM